MKMIVKYKVIVSLRGYYHDEVEFDDEEFVDLEDYLRSDEFELCEDADEYGDFQIDHAEKIA
jgi:hypothetical protein